MIKKSILILATLAFLAPNSLLYARDFSEVPSKKIVISQPQKGFPEGERFDYAVYWMGFRIGSASLFVKEIVNINGRDLYHIVARARTHGFFANFYKLNDVMETYVDKETLFPVLYEEDLDEKWRKSRQSVEFNQANKTAVYKDREGNAVKEVEIPRGVQDMVSCFYLLRTMELENGKAYNIWVNMDEQNWEVQIKIVGVARLELRKKGTFETFIVSPRSGFRNMALARNKTFIYFSADEKRVPLFIKAFTRKGIITAALEMPDKL